MSKLILDHVSGLHFNTCLCHFTSPIPPMLWFSPLSCNNLPFLILSSFLQGCPCSDKQWAQRKARDANFHLFRWEWSSFCWLWESKSGSSKCCQTPFSSAADPLQWTWSTRIISSPGNWGLKVPQGSAIKTLVFFLILNSWIVCSAGSKHKHWLVSHMEPADLLCEVWIQRCFSPRDGTAQKRRYFTFYKHLSVLFYWETSWMSPLLLLLVLK